MSGSAPIVTLVIGGGPMADDLLQAVATSLDHRIDVRPAHDVAAAEAIALEVVEQGGIIPFTVVIFDASADPSPGCLGIDAVIDAHDSPPLVTTRIVLATTSTSLKDVDTALRNGAMHGMISRPWTAEGLRKVATAHLATFVVEHAPERIEDLVELLGEADLTEARRRIELRETAHDRDLRLDDEQGAARRSHPLLDTSAEDEQLEVELVEALDRALGHPPRIRVAPGTTLIEAGEDVGGIYVLLEGRVRLTSTTPTGEQVLHEQSTGSILGLLSLAGKRRAMLQCRAVTEVRAIPVTIDQLAHAFDADAAVSGLLNRVLIGSLARRLRRSDALQVELDQSLVALSEARAQLVSSAQLTTLGELSAGLAHELNNPVAALVRAIDGVTDQLTNSELVEDDAAAIITDRLEHDPVSPAEARALRRQLTEQFGDRRTAERLIALGVTDVADTANVDALVAALSTNAGPRLESAAVTGTRLRDAASAARRVEALVSSLRSYVRGEDGRGVLVPDVDVARTIRSAVGLLAHRFGDTEVVFELDEVPHIAGRPGALQTVWGNLVANALDALSGDAPGDALPCITVELTERTVNRQPCLSVHVTDNGPGIPPDTIERVFEPRFTTKHGRVSFGLGLGLSISRHIVDEHGGTISVESRPGRTTFDVVLPIDGPHRNAPATPSINPEISA